MPGGAAFADALRRCWDDGDAVLPLDLRLARPARQQVLEALRPSIVLDASGRSAARPDGEPVEDGDALVVATSGTTGEPKGVILTHAAVEASARATSTYLAVDPARDRWLACLPLAHVGGLSVVTRALVTGTPVEIHHRFAEEDVRSAARDRGATLVSLVPVSLARLGLEGATLFRAIVLGGQQPPAGRPSNTVATYGMTETGSGVVYEGVALEGVEVRIEAGEVWIRCPMLLRGGPGRDRPEDPRRLVRDGRRRRPRLDGPAPGSRQVGRRRDLGRREHLAGAGRSGARAPSVGPRRSGRRPPGRTVGFPRRRLRRAVTGRARYGAGRDPRRSARAGEGTPVPLRGARELVVVAELPRTEIGKVRRAELASLVGLSARIA